MIGGDATHPALVTIAASDASGNPLAISGDFVIAGSLGSDAPCPTSPTFDVSAFAATEGTPIFPLQIGFVESAG